MANPTEFTRDWSRPETHPEQLERRIAEQGVDEALGLICWMES